MIIGVFGPQRSGKTLFASSIVRYISVLYPVQVYANYSLGFEYTRFEKWKDLEEVYNSIIILDEIVTSADSRNYKSEDQMYFTHLFAQMGKRGNTFFYTAQNKHMVEKRVRDQTDWEINARKNWETGEILYSIVDVQLGELNARIIGQYLMKDPSIAYALYDSFEVVKTQLKTEQQTSRKSYWGQKTNR